MPENFEKFALRARRRFFISTGFSILALLAAGFFKSIFLSIALFFFVLLLLASGFWEIIKATKSVYREREERLSILASLSDGIIQYSADKKIIFMNPKAEEYFGVKQKDIADLKIVPDLWDDKPIYRALVEIIYPELAPFTLARGGESFSSEKGIEIHTSRPELRLFVLSKEIKNTSGEVTGHVKIMRDISHDALISKIKSEFVSVAAHQLRTPLAALKWTLRLFIDGDMGPLEPKQLEFLNRGFETAERMIKLVNDLLDAARIEEGRFGYEFIEIDYLDFIAKLIKNYELVSKEKKISINLFPVKDLIPTIYADRERLLLAFSNIIENALRYTNAAGKVDIDISLEKDYVKTVISDTGVGIPKEEQKRVFSKFFRASNAIRLETEGTGLGLFIVRNIIRRHGGEVTFVSKEGKGTAFTILLPIKRELIPMREGRAVEEYSEGI